MSDEPSSEGARLEALLGSRIRAEFARAHNIPGGPSMIAQHVSGNRPISLEAAIAYCRGLNVTLDELSPRLAALVMSAASHLGDGRHHTIPTAALLDQLGEMLAAVPEGQRDAAAQALAGWARGGGAAHWRAMFVAAITPTVASSLEPVARFGTPTATVGKPRRAA